MKIDALSLNPGSDIYYDPQFRITLEDHMDYLRKNAGTTLLTISGQLSYKFEADLFGLLMTFNIPPHLHFVVMRMNNLSSPFEITRRTESLLIPNEVIVDQIRQSYTTTKRLN